MYITIVKNVSKFNVAKKFIFYPRMFKTFSISLLAIYLYIPLNFIYILIITIIFGVKLINVF